MDIWWTWWLTILVGVVGAYYALYQRMNYFKRKGVPYAKGGIPFFGNLAPTVFRRLAFPELVQRWYNQNPDVKYIGLFEFMTPVVMLRDPEVIKSVGIKNFESFQDHESFLNEDLDPMFTKNLFFLKGERWRDVRTLLSPAFTSSKMKTMFKLVSQCSVNLSDYLVSAISKPTAFEMRDTFTRYTNDVIATSAFGISVNSLKERNNEFYEMGIKATTMTGPRTAKILVLKCLPFLGKIFSIRLIEENISKFFSHVISSNIESRTSQKIDRNDMIQLMLQAKEKPQKMNLTVEDMTAQAFIFFFGGFDTSSTLMCFATYAIGTNPAVQKKLQAEIDAVLADCNGEVTYEALLGMQYLDMVINEVLRLYPPVAAIDRVCNRAFELPPAAPGFPPYTVEVGTVMLLPYYALHRDPKHFSDPEKFDPERFSEAKKNKIPGYFPFGVGPRSCIGERFGLMESKLALFHLLAKFDLSPCEKTSIPMELDKSNFNTSAANGFWLTVQKRSQF